jgi:hypothetical protein
MTMTTRQRIRSVVRSARRRRRPPARRPKRFVARKDRTIVTRRTAATRPRRMVTGRVPALVRFGCGQAAGRMDRMLRRQLQGSEWIAFCDHLRKCPACHDKFLVMELSLALCTGVTTAVT